MENQLYEDGLMDIDIDLNKIFQDLDFSTFEKLKSYLSEVLEDLNVQTLNYVYYNNFSKLVTCKISFSILFLFTKSALHNASTISSSI